MRVQTVGLLRSESLTLIESALQKQNHQLNQLGQPNLVLHFVRSTETERDVETLKMVSPLANIPVIILYDDTVSEDVRSKFFKLCNPLGVTPLPTTSEQADEMVIYLEWRTKGVIKDEEQP